jgi:hypothetical protein
LSRHTLRVFALFLLLLSVACGSAATPQPPGAPTPVVVRILNLDLALTALPPTPVPPTPTPAPTVTPFPTFTPRPPAAQAENQANTTPSCTNLAEFIKNLNINDNASFEVQSPIAKIWQIKNAGTCVWTTSYTLVFITGDPMSAPASKPLAQEVQPGQTLDLRLDLVAPQKPGPYATSWMLQDANGNRFGLGADGSQPLSLSIVVKTPPRPTPG